MPKMTGCNMFEERTQSQSQSPAYISADWSMSMRDANI